MARLQQEQQQRETPDRQSAVTLARKQPKSPEEEKRLQECYGGLLLEERAHENMSHIHISEPTRPY